MNALDVDQIIEQPTIVIVGGGIVGLTAALLLKSLGQVTVLDKGGLSPKPLHVADRVLAINHASVQLFKTIGVWSDIQMHARAYDLMQVCDDQSGGQITFDAKVLKIPNLGYFVSQQVIVNALLKRIGQTKAITCYPHTVCEAIERQLRAITVRTSQHSLTANLLVGSDGAHSTLRDLLGFPTDRYKYTQQALTTTIEVESSCQTMAWQKFMEDGTLACLPIDKGNRYGIVWTALPERLQTWQAWSAPAFARLLQSYTDGWLKQVQVISPRLLYPLQFVHARSYIQAHAVLIGDAMHTTHPLAGLGLNVGLLDVASLYTVCRAAQQQHQPFYERLILRRYERQRKANVVKFLMMIEALNYGGTATGWGLQLGRYAGLQMCDRVTCIKRYVARYALGGEFCYDIQS